MDKTDNEILPPDLFLLADFMEFPYERIVPQYHKDWSALMPVWYKFRDLKFDDIDTDDDHDGYCEKISRAILNVGPSPEAAFKALVEAVKWYNTIKK